MKYRGGTLTQGNHIFMNASKHFPYNAQYMNVWHNFFFCGRWLGIQDFACVEGHASSLHISDLSIRYVDVD